MGLNTERKTTAGGESVHDKHAHTRGILVDAAVRDIPQTDLSLLHCQFASGRVWVQTHDNEGATSTMLVMCCNGTGSAVLHTKRVGLTEFLWSILCILRMHLRALLKLCRPRPSMEGSSELLCKSNHALHQTHYGRTKERGGGRRNTEGGRGDGEERW